MKNKLKMIPLLCTALFLSSCMTNGGNMGGGNTNNGNTITYDDFDNYDTDPINEIVEDEKESEVDTSLDELEENETNKTNYEDEYDSFTDNKLDKNGGRYYLKGNYDKIWINASKGSEMYVYLDGVTINSSEGIAFGSDKQITLHLIILNNSVNTIGNDYIVSDTLEDTNAFHVKGDVYITGEGTLNVSSTVKSGIKVSKNLYILGNVNINASGLSHAIAAQSMSIKDAKLNLSSQEKDGLNVETDGKITTYSTEQGFIILDNVDLTADTYGDGVQAASYIDVIGGKINITTHGEFVQYSSSLVSNGEYARDDFKFLKSGSTYKRVASDEIRSLSSSYYALKNSVKGLKVGPIEYEDANEVVHEVTTGDYHINISHLADVTINSTDDCIHTNYGNTIVNSSNLELETFDDGLHADYNLEVDNCAILVKASYEGLEGGNVTINGENTNIVAISSDDGINAASDYVSTNNININAGYIRVYASGDGIDANTTLNINGGTVIVEGPGSNNGSLDAEIVKLNGGLVFACSTNGMQEKTTATQTSFLYQGNTMSSGALITIADENNEAIFSYTLKASCNQLIFSSSGLKLNSTYKILSGTTTVASIKMTSTFTTNSSSGGFGPGGGGPGPGRR